MHWELQSILVQILLQLLIVDESGLFSIYQSKKILWFLTSKLSSYPQYFPLTFQSHLHYSNHQPVHLIFQRRVCFSFSIFVLSSYHLAKFSQSDPGSLRLCIPLDKQLEILKFEMHSSSSPSIVFHQIFRSNNSSVASVYQFEEIEIIKSVLK